MLKAILTDIFSPSSAPLNVLLSFYINLPFVPSLLPCHVRSALFSQSASATLLGTLLQSSLSLFGIYLLSSMLLSLHSPLPPRCMNAHREKLLTEHLRKIYGPTFSVESDLLSSAAASPLAGSDTNRSFVSSPTPSSTFPFPIPPTNRRTSGFGALVQSTSSGSLSAPLQQQGKKGKLQQNESFDAAALMQQLEGVQDLVGRFERRLLIRESELLKKEEEAHLESRRLEKMEVGVMKQSIMGA